MFLENLDALLKERGINRNVLSKVSGIPYTTIIGWYKKGWNSVSLTSLKKLSAYFGISIDTLVGNKAGDEKLSPEESTLIRKYRRLDEHGKKTIDIFLSSELDRPYADNEVKLRRVAEPDDDDAYGV